MEQSKSTNPPVSEETTETESLLPHGEGPPGRSVGPDGLSEVNRFRVEGWITPASAEGLKPIKRGHARMSTAGALEEDRG